MTETIIIRKTLSAVDTALITTLSERGHAIFTTRMAADTAAVAVAVGKGEIPDCPALGRIVVIPFAFV